MTIWFSSSLSEGSRWTSSAAAARGSVEVVWIGSGDTAMLVVVTRRSEGTTSSSTLEALLEDESTISGPGVGLSSSKSMTSSTRWFSGLDWIRDRFGWQGTSVMPLSLLLSLSPRLMTASSSLLISPSSRSFSTNDFGRDSDSYKTIELQF